jgi:enoyl-CoA hydratase/carnithine racemase
VTYFTVEHRDSIALVTFRRPPRNLMSMAAMTELEGVLSGLATDDSVNVVVITGGVPGYFIAHADLDDLIKLGKGEPIDGDPLSWTRTFALMDTMAQPVVAAINGQAWGGGCELSLACTLRVASESAHFGQPEVAVGIIPGGGGTQRLPRLIGAGRAADLILSARVIAADEAERIGLVEAVLPDDGFVEAAVTWARRIADQPRHAVIAAKRAMLDGLKVPLEEGLRIEGRHFLECQTAAATLSIQQKAADRYRAAADDQHVELNGPI